MQTRRGFLGRIIGAVAAAVVAPFVPTKAASSLIAVDPAGPVILTLPAVATPGQWFHIANGFDPATKVLRWYIDGKLVSEVPVQTTLGPSALDLPSPPLLVLRHGDGSAKTQDEEKVEWF